ncbi:MAG: hypothetical protein HOO88_03780 [Kiritimatiellaceae bacterium]|nr:hypothetical protein [Kiritimatiellaceae bacterium]
MKNKFVVLSFVVSGIWLNGAAAFGGAFFNVRDYGATGDSQTLDSPAINKAIDAAAASGGGTVLVPAGTYLSGSIRLKSNIHLLIDAGATILGAPQEMNAYDETEPYTSGGYQDGGHSFFHNSLIWGENLTNVFITGHGMINGGGLISKEKTGIMDRMIGFTGDALPAFPPGETSGMPPVRIGNKAIALKLCRNVVVRDITIFRGGHFAILATGCDGMTVDNVTMDTSRDGIDVDCCRNVTISNCRVNTPVDDGICLKSTYALGEVRLTEDVTIVNCQLSAFPVGTLVYNLPRPAWSANSWCNGRIKLGTESSGGFRNIVIANCIFRHSLGLALEQVDGGIMENISISNLTMTEIPDYGIYITTGNRNRTPNLTTASRARNINISNVIIDGTGPMSGIQIMGLPEQPLEGIRLENIRLISRGGGTQADAAIVPPELGSNYPEPRQLGTLPAYGIFARHVRDLELANIRVSYEKEDLRPAIVCTDVDGLEIDNFKAQVAPGVVAARFDDVKRLIIRNSPVLDGAPGR